MKLYILKDSKNHIQAYAEIESEGMIEIEVEELPEDFSVNFFAYKYSNGQFTLDNKYLNSILNIHNLQFEKDEILKWLADNDWKVNKFVLGEWTKDDQRWIDYIDERNIKRKKLEELEEV